MKLKTLIFTISLFASLAAVAQDKPYLVIVFMDNYGWGEPGFNGGGIVRGAETPQMDKLEPVLFFRSIPIESNYLP